MEIINVLNNDLIRSFTMSKFDKTRIGISSFSIFTRVLKKQAEEIFNDLEKNSKSRSSQVGPIIPNENGVLLRYDGDNICIKLNMESPEEKQRYEYCIISALVWSGSPIEMVVDKEIELTETISEYDKVFGSISKSMPAFSEYTISEIDYCIAFDLKELGYEFITYELWNVVQRGIYSYQYTKKKYNPCSCSWLESNDKTSYFTAHHISVKHIRDRCDNKSYPVNNFGSNSTNMILFVMKSLIKYSMNTIMRELITEHSNAEIHQLGNLLMMKHLMSANNIKSVITKSFESTIMRGNYFNLELAVEAVEESDFNKERKK